MPGLEIILRGILSYRSNIQPTMVKQFQEVKANPEPKAVLFSCMDSRVLLTRALQSHVGDMFIVRNAGNLVPHNDSLSFDAVTTEPGALELGCVRNKIRQVVVCGHSDCKAMGLLHQLQDEVGDHIGSPLELWLKKHAGTSISKFQKWKAGGSKDAIQFIAETPKHVFEAYIDRERKFSEVDQLSQINTLQQLQNIASHPILTSLLQNDLVHLNALWLDIGTGDFHMFSREKKSYLKVDESTFEHLLKDGQSYRQ